MPQIRPITDLRNTNEISDICHARKEPVFITKNGYGELVNPPPQTLPSHKPKQNTHRAGSSMMPEKRSHR